METPGLKVHQCSNGFIICVFKRLLTAVEYMCQYYTKQIKSFKRNLCVSAVCGPESRPSEALSATNVLNRFNS